jgi:hypothetical protein
VFPRFLHITKSDLGPGGKPRYGVYDANRNGDAETGFAQPTPVLNREEAVQLLEWEGLPQIEIDRLLQKVDQEGGASVPLKARIGPRIVRAWFDTVINPLIESLESELTLAVKGNWTWRFQPPSLELIRPARRYLERTAVASFDQICGLESETNAMTQSHDDAVKNVFESVATLHNALIASQTFTGLCDSLWDPDALLAAGLRDIQDIIGASPLEDRYSIIAQYIVNNVGDLPNYYTTAKFWNRHRAALMGALDGPEIRPHHESLAHAGRRLEGTTQGLLRRLKDLRLRLSLEHDVPYSVGSPAATIG